MTISNATIHHHDHLAPFMAAARKFPLLSSAEHERALVRRWREDGDEKALAALLGSHLRLAIKIAAGFRGYGLPLDDLIAEANVGLMQAAERFDPDRGFRFSTYARWWIRAAIQEYILRAGSMVRMGTTAAQKKLFFNLRRLKAQLAAYEEGDLPPETVRAIADMLDVPEDTVIEMNRRMSGQDQSLNAPVGEDGSLTRQDFLVSQADDQETLLLDSDEHERRWQAVQTAMAGLSERERHIVVERKLSEPPKTLEDLANVYGISRERVRQIENKALTKLRQQIDTSTTTPLLAAA
jgi:RNA polymerase sigma-32 factor